MSVDGRRDRRSSMKVRPMAAAVAANWRTSAAIDDLVCRASFWTRKARNANWQAKMATKKNYSREVSIPISQVSTSKGD